MSGRYGHWMAGYESSVTHLPWSIFVCGYYMIWNNQRAIVISSFHQNEWLEETLQNGTIVYLLFAVLMDSWVFLLPYKSQNSHDALYNAAKKEFKIFCKEKNDYLTAFRSFLWELRVSIDSPTDECNPEPFSITHCAALVWSNQPTLLFKITWHCSWSVLCYTLEPSLIAL